MRASIRVETTGRPTVSIVCEGFEGQARATGRGHGFDDMALASTVGHVDAQDPATMESNLLAQTVDQVVVGLSSVAPNRAAATATERAPRDVAVTGTLDHINQEFLQRGWSDGLPIIPPTIGRVESFIAATGHDPCKQLGIAASSGRDITVWSIAVNAVMTGCDPQHLPVLLAMAEILADPHYGAEHSGNTTGADAIAIVSGPSMAQLGFNAGAGVLIRCSKHCLLRPVCGPGDSKRWWASGATSRRAEEHWSTWPPPVMCPPSSPSLRTRSAWCRLSPSRPSL